MLPRFAMLQKVPIEITVPGNAGIEKGGEFVPYTGGRQTYVVNGLGQKLMLILLCFKDIFVLVHMTGIYRLQNCVTKSKVSSACNLFCKVCSAWGFNILNLNQS